MAIQPAASAPLVLNHYLFEVPEKNAVSLNRKSIAFRALEKICWVAFVAIIATVFTISYTGIALTGHLPLVIVAMALSAPFLGLGATKFGMLSKEYGNRAERERGVTGAYREIANWTEAEIQNFLQEQNLHLSPATLDALRTKNAQHPLRVLLPLIARFRSLDELSRTSRLSAHRKLSERVIQQLPQREVEQGHTPDRLTMRRIILATRQIGWRQMEQEAIPRALDAALMLHFIEHPDIPSFSLTDLGDIEAKSFEERSFDRTFPPVNDHYFVFRTPNRPRWITLREIEDAALSPRLLRLKLFPPVIQA